MLPEIDLTWRGFTLSFHAYTVFACLSIGLGLVLAFIELRRSGLTFGRSLSFCLSVGIGFVVGARLLNYALNYQQYRQLGIPILYLGLSYFSLYGGILLSGLVVFLLAKGFQLRLKSVFDSLTLPFLCSFPVMKIGCFLNGCCSGIQTHVFFGVPLRLAERQQWKGYGLITTLLQPENIRVYPVQLMEALAAVLIALILIFIRKRLQEGSAFYTAAFLFSGARLILLNFRSTGYTPFVVHQLYPALYVGIMAISLILLFRNEVKERTAENHTCP